MFLKDGKDHSCRLIVTLLILILLPCGFALSQSKIDKTTTIHSSVRLSGRELKAFVAAYDSFRKASDLAEARKDLVNYEIEITEVDKNFFVHFVVKDSPGTVTALGGETTLGRQARYTVSKPNYQVISTLLYR